jgi:type IV secretion system protein VirB4
MINETANQRRRAMLLTAMGPVISHALADPDVIEVMANPDGSLWIDRLGKGRGPAEGQIGPPAMDRRTWPVRRGADARSLRRQARPGLSGGSGPSSAATGVARMLSLAEYRSQADRLADFLPWAALVGPGIVLNKDGSVQRTFLFRGPDLESASEGELVGLCARANNALKRLGSGWALFFEAERAGAQHYPTSNFPDAASWLVDEERRISFEEGHQGKHFESRYYLTLLFMPPPDAQARTEKALLDSGREEEGRDWRRELGRFREETDRMLDLLSGFLPEIRALDDAETLTYLHGTVSTKRHPVAVPETPMYLDGVLADTSFTGGLEPMLGAAHLRTLTILGFPNATCPGILDALNHQDFGYRWVTRFIPLDKTEATKVLTRLRRQWFAKRKSVTAILREVMTSESSTLVDSDADNKARDADAALQALGGDHVGFGYFTASVTVWDKDWQQAEDKARAVERIINNIGFTCIRESVNAVEAWLGSLPGHVYANIRQPLVHTLNLAHLMPLSALWAGPERNAHLDGPPLFYAETSGSTPFRFSTHVGDVGHMLVVGPTGAGKSVLLSLIALQFRRYQGAQVYIFDKGRSARAATLAMGGEHYALGADGALSFQPLRNIDDPATRSWAIKPRIRFWSRSAIWSGFRKSSATH